MRHSINAHNGAEAKRSVQTTGRTVHPEACLGMVATTKTSASASAAAAAALLLLQEIEILLSPAASRFTTL